MYKAFHQLLPYNLQIYFTIKSNEYGIETKQKTCSINHMYVKQRNNIAYLLLE